MSQGPTRGTDFGMNGWVHSETPAGDVDDSNALFTCANGYIGGSLIVWLNGQRKFPTDDFVETSPGAGTFTFVTAPATGASVRVDYMMALSVTGNADTVDGIHGTELLSNKMYWDNKGTSELLSNQLVQRGWNFGAGGASTTTTTAIVLPIEYDDTDYLILLTFLGMKNTAGDPASIADINSNYGDVWMYVKGTTGIATTGFTANCHRSGGNFGAGLSAIFDWCTIGTKA